MDYPLSLNENCARRLGFWPIANHLAVVIEILQDHNIPKTLEHPVSASLLEDEESVSFWDSCDTHTHCLNAHAHRANRLNFPLRQRSAFSAGRICSFGLRDDTNSD